MYNPNTYFSHLYSQDQSPWKHQISFYSYGGVPWQHCSMPCRHAMKTPNCVLCGNVVEAPNFIPKNLSSLYFSNFRTYLDIKDKIVDDINNKICATNVSRMHHSWGSWTLLMHYSSQMTVLQTHSSQTKFKGLFLGCHPA